ncbi:NAD-dependent epimerase/dehydratase family protein [Cavenderia fasciculata]|uniref:NAD-dependent epimerase/dehydratase family protein n=1 Tax=Cavenderia fasciculata TaxID=261658 RepID=F4PXU0_CACFS|nr:NAD-dependent epimerase/dehydratase family protein [Cavenderia fasciculata]EGG19600.1 NAD-dependent epimerase/dehydratase family protein [Cavenderia fasciculata]|eukprot:XP_004357894.1 NAD-dependent epimerase/dehydratase family protein [Cavenderia fasciculata]
MSTVEEKKKIVVTGANGYIASYVVKSLLLKGYAVTAIVRDKNNVAKYEHLVDLLMEDGMSGSLEVESGDLESADYLSIFKGSYAVIHCASPYVYTADDVQRDIIQPAIAGNLRVLEAAQATPSIKKVIITSSTAAVTDLTKQKEVYDESDWNDSASEATPYQYSKVLAEKATWNFRKEKGPLAFEIIVINPSFVVGPALSRTLNTSLSTLEEGLRGVGAPFTQRRVGLVDVRDVADAHVVALESKQSLDGERATLCNTVMTFHDVTVLAKSLFPHYTFTPVDMSTVPTPFQYKIVSNSKVKLGRDYTPFNQSISETVEYLIRINKFKPHPTK